MNYPETKYPIQKETYETIGLCMEVHRNLGHGFLEIVYKDALEYEFQQNGIPYECEKEYDVNYKDTVLGLLVNFGEPSLFHKRFIL